MHSMRFFLLLILPFTLLLSEQIDVKNAFVRSSFESVEISNTEDMGLMGLSYLLEYDENFYYGLGVYGALAGERGGFFVGGINLGAKYELFSDFYLDAGIFAGGGGGASAPQGGGLMIKSYLGGLYSFDNYALGVNYSNINFPNGGIKSNQVSLVADMKFDTILVNVPVDIQTLSQYNFVNNNDYLVGTYQVYFPKNGTKKTNKVTPSESFQLLGVEYGRNISKNFITYIESAGAVNGDSTGYMEVLGGVGYSRETLNSNTKLQAKLSLGGAGGGQVDTGGGFVSKVSMHMNYSPAKSLNTGIAAGYYHAVEGTFDASFVKLHLGMNTNFLSISKSNNAINYDSISTQKLNFRLSNQTYLYSDNLSTKDNKLDIQLIGMKVDYFLGDEFYLSGQAITAYKGEAGGYAVGLFGIGYIQPAVNDFSLVGELSVGASGGGSIESGSGNIIQPMLGVMYKINEKLALEIMYGNVKALNGKLDTNVVDFGLVYSFDTLTGK